MASTLGQRLFCEWKSANARTQRALADELGTTQQNVSRWLNGAPPELANVFAIERLTGIPAVSWTQPDHGPSDDATQTAHPEQR